MEMKFSFDGIISRLNTAEESIMSLKIYREKWKKKNRIKKLNTKQNVQEPWDNYKICNIHKIGMPEGVKKKKTMEEQKKFK